ncbi:MAG: GNAT family N-acetyltransferase [Bacteroidota bacterium]|nr:GNAT family N-acetyltransferase [Chitinophagaceae bacterium]MDZ4808048.1 GNAT family N-acetyltransferase [Bacteroidota bacterium]
MITIRIATINDAELIADISRQTFLDTFASQNTTENIDKFMNETFSKEALMKEVGTAGNIFLLAYDGNEPVGYVRMRENNNPPELGNIVAIEIARIYATVNSIGKGVGKALMQKCIEIAASKMATVIWLGVWEENHRAIDFYTQWGFEKFSTHVFMLGDDPQTDWLMKKTIVNAL